MRENPTVRVNGQTKTVTSDKEVIDVFEQHASFRVGTHVEELLVDTIDAELDYNIRYEEHILRCHVYFQPLDGVNMGSVKDENLTVSGWTRESQMIGDNELCIIYEKAIDD